MTTVRTRFAPSPTGMLHIGGFRSALYAWLLARHHGGEFLLRIEDTDRERKVEGAIQGILDCFEWFGLDIDEGPTKEELAQIDEDVTLSSTVGQGDFGPYIQSLRLKRYQEVCSQLIESGHAYRCDCAPEMLDQEREAQKAAKQQVGYGGRCRDRNVSADTPHVVRFKMPENPELVLQDGIRGEITWESIPLKDPIIVKSDGFPTYHLAVVVDDYDMKISHAMRGEEWIPSTPLHLLLYNALGWEPPIYCHLPVVLGTDGKKLSKRHGSTAWDSFKDQGYLPEAVVNFVARIGWSPGDGCDEEIFSLKEMAERFSLEKVNPSSGVFDYDKLQWMNGLAIRALSFEEFTKRVNPFLEKEGIKLSPEQWALIGPHIQERTKVLTEVAPQLECLVTDSLEREIDQMLSKKVDAELAKKILTSEKEALSVLETFDVEHIEPAVKALAQTLEVKAGALFLPLRIATLGKKATPPLFESLQVIGKEVTVKRIEDAILEL